MSHTEHASADLDDDTSLYAPLLAEIHAALNSLITNHNQITAHQPARAQQSLQNAATWHAQNQRMHSQYLASSNRLSYRGLLTARDMDTSLDNLSRRLQLADEQFLRREVNMAQRQIQDCERLMESVVSMIERLRADEERYLEEREERDEWDEAQRREEALAWRIQAEERNRSIRAWVNSSAAVEMGDEESTDQETGYSGE
ncbi:hypothetical protein FRC08_003664 [Ceratobasidium sp. 394]|nr:hypothetical protein FRC08_003664 [Ceratobasidium sp. 394]KAG9096474.1 hypothetical protein FS749_008394 [Ceratobasidium sp. UAMH 11750]